MPNSGHMPDSHPDVPENVWEIAIGDLPGTVQGLYDEKCRAALHKLKEAAMRLKTEHSMVDLHAFNAVIHIIRSLQKSIPGGSEWTEWRNFIDEIAKLLTDPEIVVQFTVQPREKRERIQSIKIHGKTVAGEKGVNEDTLYFDETKGYLGVGDGMGSYKGGAMAAAIEKITMEESLGNLRPNLSVQDVKRALMSMARRVHEAIQEQARAKPRDYDGMAATLTVIQFVKEHTITKAVIASFGDSRVYRLRGEKLEQMTIDDSVMAGHFGKKNPKTRALQQKFSQVTQGDQLVTREEKAFWKMRNETVGLGKEHLIFGEEGIMIEGEAYESFEDAMCVIDVQKGDRFLVCSDGITDYLTDAEIEEILNNGGTEDDLIRAAQKRAEEREHFRTKSYRDDMTAGLAEAA